MKIEILSVRISKIKHASLQCALSRGTSVGVWLQHCCTTFWYTSNKQWARMSEYLHALGNTKKLIWNTETESEKALYLLISLVPRPYPGLLFFFSCEGRVPVWAQDYSLKSQSWGVPNLELWRKLKLQSKLTPQFPPTAAR